MLRTVLSAQRCMSNMHVFDEIYDMRYDLNKYWVAPITSQTCDAVIIYRTIRNGISSGGVSHPVVRLINEDLRDGV